MKVTMGKNPFKGLYYYEEADKDIFFGRDDLSRELFKLVVSNGLTLVFGKSGIGKTSLLNAGLFPLLRAANFLPVRLRMDYSSTGAPLIDQVKLALQKQLLENNVMERVKGGSEPTHSFSQGETLWEYFHRVDHINKSFYGGPGGGFLEKSPLVAEGNVIPVLVFDQFEELFTIGKRHPQRDLLIDELNDLVEDQLPTAVKERILSRAWVFPYLRSQLAVRVVFGLREDYLPHMNALKPSIPSIHRVMFRVIHLNGIQAREVLDKTGAFANEGIKQDILRQFDPVDLEPGQTVGPGKLEVEPALLSLLCYQVFEQGVESLSVREKDAILSGFYDRVLSQLPRGSDMAQWIEDHLLTEGGFRTPFYLERGIELRDTVEAAIDKKLLRKLFIGEKEHVEIIHDVLAPVIKERRNRRREEKKRLELEKELRRKRVMTGIITLAFIIASMLAIFAFIQKNRADVQYIEAVKQRKIAEENEQLAIKEKNRADDQTQKAVLERNLKEEQRKIAEEKTEEVSKKTEEVSKQKKRADDQRNKAEEKTKEAIEQKTRADEQTNIAKDKEQEATFSESLTKAKELAAHSIVQTGDIQLKTLLAIYAYSINDNAYSKRKFGKYKCPPEIFEALRQAYIANNEENVHPVAESWALAAVDDNKLIYTDPEGKLRQALIQKPQNNKKLLDIKEEPASSNAVPYDTRFFVQSSQRLYLSTTEGKIFYWGKNNWDEIKKLPGGSQGVILSIAYSRYKNCLFYSIKDTVYSHDPNSIKEPIRILSLEEGNFIRALIIIEEEKNSFIVLGDENGDIYSFNLKVSPFEKRKLKLKLEKKPTKTPFYSVAFNPKEKLLVFGNLKGEILFLTDIDCQKLSENDEIEGFLSEKQHKGVVKTLVFDDGGRYLASGGLDGVIMLWDNKNGSEKIEAKKIASQIPNLTIDNKSKILSAIFVQRGEYVYLIYSGEKKLNICPTNPSVFYEILCATTERDFTETEKRNYIGDFEKKLDFKICAKNREK